jgi:hypothetical protein
MNRTGIGQALWQWCLDRFGHRQQLALGDGGKSAIVRRLLAVTDGVMEFFRTGKGQEEQPLAQKEQRQYRPRDRGTGASIGPWHAKHLSAAA